MSSSSHLSFDSTEFEQYLIRCQEGADRLAEPRVAELLGRRRSLQAFSFDDAAHGQFPHSADQSPVAFGPAGVGGNPRITQVAFKDRWRSKNREKPD